MKRKIFVGVDVASVEHRVEAIDEQGRVCWTKAIPNTHEGCEEALEQIRVWQEEGVEVWVGMEGLGGYASPLDKRLCATGVYVVGLQPTQVCRFREMVGVQPDKEDRADAKLLAQMLRWLSQNEELEPSAMRDEYFQALRDAARAFATVSGAKVKIQNQLTHKVREYWPELMVGDEFFDAKDAVGLLTLLTRYPTPEAVARAGRSRVAQLLRKASRRDCRDLADRLVAQASQVRKTASASPVTAELIQQLATNLLALGQSVLRWEKTLERLLQEHPFGRLLLAKEGIGPRTAGCFLGEAGDIGRFESDSKLARYAGNGPVLKQSGKSPKRFYDGHRYNHRLKRAVLLMARSLAVHDAESKRYVQRRRDLGDKYWQAIKKLARHLIRDLWKAWQELVERTEIESPKTVRSVPLNP
jgi:transposase